MDYVRYLSAKRSVDDRALNERVLADLDRFLQQKSTEMDQTQVVRVLEVGAGIGAMCARFLQRGTFSPFATVEYMLLDIKTDVLTAARKNLIELVYNLSPSSPQLSSNDQQLKPVLLPSATVCGSKNVHYQGMDSSDEISLPPLRIRDGFTVTFHKEDALDFAKRHESALDMIIGAAVLDLWPLEQAVPLLLACLKESGMRAFYFPVNFDGTTDLFPPSCEGPLFDASVEGAFHRAMGTRHTFDHETQAAHTGRHVVPAIMQSKGVVRSAGGSAWMVIPDAKSDSLQSGKGHGTYIRDESYFLHCIVDFIQDSVPSVMDKGQDAHWQDAFDRYVSCRRRQIEKSQLFYVAHNVDVFGCMP